MELQTQNISLRNAVEPFIPQMVLVAYRSESNKYYLETSVIRNGKPEAFVPASIDEIKTIFTSTIAAEKGHIDCGKIFPKNILHLSINAGDFEVAWYCKPSVRIIKFEKSLRIPNIKMKMPLLLFAANRNGAKLFCLKSTSLKSEVYAAPFMNIMADDAICFGSVDIKIPEITSLEKIMEIYEEAFWNSDFTDSGTKEALKMWRELAKSKPKAFPHKLLAKHHSIKTLKQLLS